MDGTTRFSVVDGTTHGLESIGAHATYNRTGRNFGTVYLYPRHPWDWHIDRSVDPKHNHPWPDRQSYGSPMNVYLYRGLSGVFPRTEQRPMFTGKLDGSRLVSLRRGGRDLRAPKSRGFPGIAWDKGNWRIKGLMILD